MSAQSIWWSEKDNAYICKLLTDKANVSAYAISIGRPLKLNDQVSVLETGSEWYFDGIALIEKNDLAESKPQFFKEALLTSAPVTIFNAITTVPSPYELIVRGTNYKGLKLVTSGTCTSRNITVTAKLNSTDVAKPYFVLNLSALDNIGNYTTGINEILQISEFDGLYAIYINVTAIAGGNLTITGQLLS